MKDITFKEISDTIRDYFTGQPEIIAIYLFGSTVGGPVTPESDIDIAALYKADHIPDFRKQIDDRLSLSEILLKEVDLVILNTASPILRMQVLKKGELVLNNKPQNVHHFLIRTLNEYFDLKYSRREIEQSLYKVSIYG